MFQRSPKNVFFREGYVKLGSLFRLFKTGMVMVGPPQSCLKGDRAHSLRGMSRDGQHVYAGQAMLGSN